MDKINYSNCPLKKRPIHVISEELEDENNAPIDLSVGTWNRTLYDKISHHHQIYKESPTQLAVNYSTKLHGIEEETTKYSTNNYEDEFRAPESLTTNCIVKNRDIVHEFTNKMRNFIVNTNFENTTNNNYLTKPFTNTPNNNSDENQICLENYEYERLQRISPILLSHGYNKPRIYTNTKNNEQHQHQLNSIPEEYSDSFEYENYDRNFNNNLIKTEFDPNLTNTHQSYYPSEISTTPNTISDLSRKLIESPSIHQSSAADPPNLMEISYEPEDLTVSNNTILLERNLNTLPPSKSRNSKSLRDKTANDLYFQCPTCHKCYATRPGLIKHQQCHLNNNAHQHLPRHDNNNQQHPKKISNLQQRRNIRAFTNLPINANELVLTPEIVPVGQGPSAAAISPILNENTPKIINVQRYQCKDCGKSYSTFSGLTKHQQFHCPNSDQNQVKKVFSCKNCDKVYVSLGALKMHIRTHTLPCKCPLCGKAFSRPWLLQGHIRTHTGEKPFTCQHCNRAFADRSNLRAHLQTHSDIKKYSCNSCTKTFSRMSLLTKHLQSGCASATSPGADQHRQQPQQPHNYPDEIEEYRTLKQAHDDNEDDDEDIDEVNFYETKQRSPVIVENSFYESNNELRQHHQYQQQHNNYSNKSSIMYQDEMGASST